MSDGVSVCLNLEDNSQELVLSFYHAVPRKELRLSDRQALFLAEQPLFLLFDLIFSAVF